MAAAILGKKSNLGDNGRGLKKSYMRVVMTHGYAYAPYYGKPGFTSVSSMAQFCQHGFGMEDTPIHFWNQTRTSNLLFAIT
eukprot:5765756-Pyramimonas_sp.AAC.1